MTLQTKKLVFLISIMFLLTLGDAIIAYVMPVYMDSTLKSASKVGFFMALSSFFAILFDLFLGKVVFSSLKKLFVYSVITAVGLAATIILVEPFIALFVFQMLIWSFYYELVAFFRVGFLQANIKNTDSTNTWGLLNATMGITYSVGPLLAVSLMSPSQSFNLVAKVAILFNIVALAIYLKFSKLGISEHIDHSANIEAPQPHRINTELKVWKKLMKHIWPVYLFTLALIMVESGFWTVGILMSEELRQTSIIGGLIVTAHVVPSIFMGLIVGKIIAGRSKKRVSYISGLLCGISISLLFLTENIYALVAMVFIGSTFYAISLPVIMATFQDYINRLKLFSGELIGLERTLFALAYILGPLLAGVLADTYSNKLSLAVLGLILAATSLAAYIVTPKKIRLPQEELIEIERAIP